MTIRSKRGPNVTPDEHKLVVKFAKQCLREICKKQYEVQMGVTYPKIRPLTYADALKRLQVETKYRNQRSYGVPKAFLSMCGTCEEALPLFMNTSRLRMIL